MISVRILATRYTTNLIKKIGQEETKHWLSVDIDGAFISDTAFILEEEEKGFGSTEKYIFYWRKKYGRPYYRDIITIY